MRKRAKSVEKLIAADIKRLPLTFSELKCELDMSQGDFRSALKIKRKCATLKLVLRCKRPDLPEACTMAVVLGTTAITYIDWHRVEFIGIDGMREMGWHQHVWSEEEGSCENHRQSLPEFNPTTVQEFIEQGFRLLNIIVKEAADGDNGQLSLA